MKVKISLKNSLKNSLMAQINSLSLGTYSLRTYIGSAFTILLCSLSGMGIPIYFVNSEAIAQPWLLAQASGRSYGLGLPKSASTSGGTRLVNPDVDDSKTIIVPSNEPPTDRTRDVYRSAPRPRRPLLLKKKQQLPLLTLITPADGARTASPQPTLYWYLYEDNQDSSSAKDVFVGQLRLTTLEQQTTTTIFETDLKIQQGLSSFKLPIAVSLKPSVTYGWQITLRDRKGEKVTASGWIVYSPPENSLCPTLMGALSLRDRAKIYAEAGYWFEAIDGYTRWLKLSPNDLKARDARDEILKAGLISTKEIDVNALIKLLNPNEEK